jgi:hypothetical protein
VGKEIVYDRVTRTRIWRSEYSAASRGNEISPDGKRVYTAADGVFEWELTGKRK